MKTDVIVLAAGYGTRLGHLTKFTPKPLLRFNEKPLIHYLLDILIKVDDIQSVNVLYSYLPEKWEESKKKYNDKVDFHLVETDQEIILQFKAILERIDGDNVLAISGDMVFDYTIISEYIAMHNSGKCEMSVLLNKNYNRWKKWNYLIEENKLVDIVSCADKCMTYERYFIIAQKKSLTKWSMNFASTSEELYNQYGYKNPFNFGWTFLLKDLLNNTDVKIRAYLLDNFLINLNDQDDYHMVEEYYRKSI